jgi:hypothetical protein
MRYPTTRLSGRLRFLLVACTVAAAGCGNSARQYEVDYNYEVLKKSADGAVTVAETAKVARAITGDGGGAGGVNTRVRGVTNTTVTIEVSLPGDKTTSLKVEPNKAVEHFPAGSEYGIRIIVSEIRAR